MSSNIHLPEVYFDMEGENYDRFQNEYEMVDVALDSVDPNKTEAPFQTSEKDEQNKKMLVPFLMVKSSQRSQGIFYLIVIGILLATVIGLATALGYCRNQPAAIQEANPCIPNPCESKFTPKVEGHFCVCFYLPTTTVADTVTPSEVECHEGYKLNRKNECKPVWLVGGNTTYEGNVFAFNTYSEIVGPVCDDNWDINAGNVVCKELGFSGAQAIKSDSAFGHVSTDFSFDEVACKGNETQLQDCLHGAGHNCGGDEGAGVVCF